MALSVRTTVLWTWWRKSSFPDILLKIFFLLAWRRDQLQTICNSVSFLAKSNLLRSAKGHPRQAHSTEYSSHVQYLDPLVA